MTIKHTLPLLISAFILTSCTSTPTALIPPASSPTTAATSTPTSAAPTAVNDDPAIGVKKDLVAKHGPSANKLKILVYKVEGNYSSGSANEEGGGGMWFAAKVDGTWKLVWDGNGIITCDTLDDYPDFPTSFIPQCYDAITDQMIKR